MGKAEIIQHKGDGLYDVKVLYNEQLARDEIQRLQNKVDRFEEKLSDLESEINQAETEYQDAQNAYDQAIQDWQDAQGTDSEDEKWKALKETQAEFIEKQYALSGLKRKRAVWKAERTSANKRIRLLEGELPEAVEVVTWCTDLSTDLSGEVGTIELPGLEQDQIQIRPGYEDGAAYAPERDGQLTPIMSQTPAQAFYNFAMLPGTQKWWPRYRSGTIYDIDPDADTCRVELDRAESQAQGIEVNDKEELQDVPIEYMTCNATAFKEGDKIVVEFPERAWDPVKVIGFLEEPQSCNLYVEVLVNNTVCNRSDWELNVFQDIGGEKGSKLATSTLDQRNTIDLIELDKSITGDLLFELHPPISIAAIKHETSNPNHYFYSKIRETYISDWDVYKQDAIYGVTDDSSSLDSSYDYTGFTEKFIIAKNSKEDLEQVEKNGEYYQAIKLEYTEICTLKGKVYQYGLQFNDPTNCCLQGILAGLGEQSLIKDYKVFGDGLHTDSNVFDEIQEGFYYGLESVGDIWKKWGRYITSEEAATLNSVCNEDFASPGDLLNVIVLARSLINSLPAISDIFFIGSNESIAIDSGYFLYRIDLDGQMYMWIDCSDWICSSQDANRYCEYEKLIWSYELLPENEIQF